MAGPPAALGCWSCFGTLLLRRKAAVDRLAIQVRVAAADENDLSGRVVGAVSALLARFRPRGMAHALFATAATQMLVPAFALLIWPPPTTSWSPSVFGVFMLSAFFALLFVVSALLFRRASTN